MKKPITLATLAEATEQEVFDQVAVHLLTQGEQSVNWEDLCMYRGDNGLQCAAGCLIGDDEYQSKFESVGWVELTDEFPEDIPKKHSRLIEELQSIHDGLYAFTWTESLKKSARDHGLSTAAIEKFEGKVK